MSFFHLFYTFITVNHLEELKKSLYHLYQGLCNMVKLVVCILRGQRGTCSTEVPILDLIQCLDYQNEPDV